MAQLCEAGDYVKSLGLLRVLGCEQRACPLEPPEPLLEGYSAWMAEIRQTAPSTLVLRRRGVRRFLRELGPQATGEGLGQLGRESIERFFLGCAEGKGESVRRCIRSSLSTFIYTKVDLQALRPVGLAWPQEATS